MRNSAKERYYNLYYYNCIVEEELPYKKPLTNEHLEVLRDIIAKCEGENISLEEYFEEQNIGYIIK